MSYISVSVSLLSNVLVTGMKATGDAKTRTLRFSVQISFADLTDTSPKVLWYFLVLF
jgi:hypothetical protein